MALRTGKRLQDRGRDTTTKGLRWYGRTWRAHSGARRDRRVEIRVARGRVLHRAEVADLGAVLRVQQHLSRGEV